MKKSLILWLFIASFGFIGEILAQGGGTKGSVSGGTKTNTYQSSNELLTTLGVTTAQGMYITYAAIGTLADAYSKGAYEKDFAIQMIGEYVALTNTVHKQLQKLLDSKTLDAADTKFIKDVLLTYGYLESEAGAYKSYMETDDYQYVTKYSENREKAWAKISELLGFKK
ncbi:MAG: hypothetical protein MUE85_00150 [Microscillaceae bacterium]|jgi:hypothetical protein|nr:hypothetical protein [Microscillaceae bacterium]